MQRDPGAGDHHRAARGGEVACDSLDLLTRNVAPGGQIVEIGLSDELAQFRYAGGEFGAVLVVLEALVEDHLDHRQ